MSIQNIYNKLNAEINNPYGTIGLMGNIQKESGFKSTNMQNSYEKRLNCTDEVYTSSVDNGIYKNFETDRVGYGLCQWTSSGRKSNLLNFAKGKGVSIGNEDMQIEFILYELKTFYKGVLKVLKDAKSVKEASDCVCTKYERPADQSVQALANRQKLGESLYKELVKEEEKVMNSPLVTYTKISPNKTHSRNHKIDTITIHCFVGQVTVERGCEVFANPLKRKSCNYVVAKDGQIGLVVNECDRSWCSSNKANDHRAITIEVASDTTAPYAVTQPALNALIELCADICKRNDIKKLVWSNNKYDRVNHKNGCNMTVHRDFANKSCPGRYLYERHEYIASEVNKRLGIKSDAVIVEPDSPSAKNYLAKGDKGEDVKKLQENLNYIGYSCGTPDGVFGSKTLNALKKFQKANKLTVDGKYGENSIKTLENAVANKNKEISTIRYTYKGVDYSPVFDPSYYSAKYPDLKKAYGTNATRLFNHFCNYGMSEGRIASDEFNVNIYKSNYVDLQKAFGNNMFKYYEHYCTFGVKEGRKGNTWV